MTAEELGCGMDNDVRTVLDGSDQIRSAEGVVYDDRQTVAVCKLCNRVDVRNVTVGVAQRLKIDRSGIVLNGVFDFDQVMRVDEGGGDAVLRQSVGEQVVAAAVDGLLGYDVTAVCR